jgi:hypothetical protein
VVSEAVEARSFRGTYSSVMYTHYEICSQLKPKVRCFRLRRYKEGIYDKLFHEHVPQHRIGVDDSLAMMKALVLRFNQSGADRILRAYLNRRDHKPESIDVRYEVEYPEPGVMRRCVIDGSVIAWMDEVLLSDTFRQTKQ